MEDFDKPLFNRYDPYVTKAKLDEYIVHYLTKGKDFTENFRFSNIKLVLGFVATLFTIVAHAYPYMFNAFFPKDFYVLLPCCIGYFTFNIAYQVVDYMLCGDIFFTTNPKDEQLKHIKEINFQSNVDKDGNYKLTVFLDLNKVEKMKGSSSMVEKGKFRFEVYSNNSVAQFFTENGSLLKPRLRKAVDNVLDKIHT